MPSPANIKIRTALGGDHVLAALGLDLQVGAAVRAAVGLHLGVDDDRRPARGAGRLGRLAFELALAPGEGPQGLLVVDLLALLPGRLLDLFAVMTVRAREPLARRVEVDPRPALGAG